MSQDTVEKDIIRLSVRNLVEFVFRSGNIDNRVGSAAASEAMQQGSRMHRKIQHRMGSGYRAEVSLSHTEDLGDYALCVEGRADGIFTKEDICYIDEIKSMYTDVHAVEAPREVHLAQARAYAYIYAREEGLDRMGVQVTYCNLETEEIRRFEEILSFEELAAWFADVIATYRKWTDYQYAWRQIRQKSIKVTEFPFSYREGQEKLVADTYRTIAREKSLFLMAPTGTGKTIATVFPAVKAVGEGLAERIFYLTAKTSTRAVAREAFDLLKAGGLQMKVLTLTAKEKLCPLDEMDCNPAHCPYAKGHFDRVGDAVYELLTQESDYTRERLAAQAERHEVCPFEMARDLALWCDVVICDYNYVFDPNVYLRRFFAEGERAECVFLVDEAHNLVERGRSMYSADLVKEDFLKFKKVFQNHNTKIVSALERCNREMLEWKRSCEKYEVLDEESLGKFPFSLMRLMSLLDEETRQRAEFPRRREVTDFYFDLRHFLNMYERMGEGDVLYTDFDERGRFVLHLACLNPAHCLQECVDRGRSAIFFSATLLPIQYYKNLLSTRSDNYAVYAETSFRPEQRLLFVAEDVTSRYTRRGFTEYQRIAGYIAAVATARRGNYIVYFPSYRYLEDVRDVFLEREESEPIDCIEQTAGMGEEEREAFLAEFAASREGSLVAFCVMGGVFAEGIDLPGEQLVGALVVGTGLPQICNEREVLRGYYDGTLSPAYGDSPSGRDGFAYAYQYPGMNKVMQAAGRVIRTARDVGVIGLLDERFLRRDYQALFPREWADARTCRLETLPALLDEFWSENKPKTRD